MILTRSHAAPTPTRPLELPEPLHDRTAHRD